MARILTVDDSITTRRIVRSTLEKVGYEVVDVPDGEQAIELINKEKYDLFLIDLYMPNMDGITLVKLIRNIKHYKFTPILMLTTEKAPSKKIEGKTAGTTGWIVKPFDPDQLVNIVNAMLE